MKKILVLGAGEYQIKIIEKLKSAGLYVIAADKNVNAVGAEFADDFLPIDIMDKEKLLSFAKTNGIDAIMPVNDFGVRSAAFVAQQLSLAGISEETADLANNKFLMRERWAAYNLSQPRFFRVKTFDECNVKVQERFTYPIILKPTDCGGGSRGVVKVNKQEELEEAFNFAKKYTFFCDDVIVEEFIKGTELTVEGISYNNDFKILAISDKEHFKSENYCVASSLNYYANISDTVKTKVINLACEAAKALSINNCPFHIEIIIKDDNPYLVEIGARAGGGHIFSTIVDWVSGVNYVNEYANILLGNKVDIFPKCERGAVFRFLSAKPGRIVEINNIDKLKNIPEIADIKILKKVGDIVTETSMDNERLGYVVTLSNSRENALKIAKLVEDTIDIVTV